MSSNRSSKQRQVYRLRFLFHTLSQIEAAWYGNKRQQVHLCHLVSFWITRNLPVRYPFLNST